MVLHIVLKCLANMEQKFHQITHFEINIGGQEFSKTICQHYGKLGQKR